MQLSRIYAMSYNFDPLKYKLPSNNHITIYPGKRKSIRPPLERRIIKT
uniref:Uncharacterized protein n=1 Tax=Arundo donax TaxID=35708 RepID=A0A0A8XX19_ARUDO